MNSFDWSQFEVRVPIKASGKDLYGAWASRKGIEHWFVRYSPYMRKDGTLCNDEELVQTGHTYSWRWHGWPDEMEEHGTILDCNGKDHFKFSFGKAGNCTVSVKEENDFTMVELVQSEIPSDEQGRQFWHLGCKTGWTFYFANMKSLFEGGIDLRNKDVNIKNVISS